MTETHIHADFVSGARELAERTGARLLLSGEGGDGWRYRYADEAGADTLCDGGIFEVGRVSVRVMHTPGHTPEHLMFVVTDTASATEPMGAFTGDFLFVGDVGRPDLLERAAGQAGTMDAAARQLFRSLQRLAPLPDWLQVWPGHGAGSACGKALGAVPQSTLGYERRFNWAFGVADEEAFVRAVLAGPARAAALLRQDEAHQPRRATGARRPRSLRRGSTPPAWPRRSRPARSWWTPVPRASTSPRACRAPSTSRPAARSPRGPDGCCPTTATSILVVDDRTGHADGRPACAGSPASGSIAWWAWPGPRCSTTGARGRGPCRRSRASITSSSTRRSAASDVAVLDVRTVAEWSAGHLPGAMNIPLGELQSRVGELPRGRPLVVHCQAGGRAAIAASVLSARGVTDLRLYGGGYTEWSAAGHPTASGAASEG